MGDKETRVTKQIMAFLESTGAYVIKHHVSQFSTAGVPDVLACLHGRFVAIEVKAHESLEPTKLQEHHLASIRASGGIAFCTYSLNDCIDKLRNNWPSAVEMQYGAINNHKVLDSLRTRKGRDTYPADPRYYTDTDT